MEKKEERKEKGKDGQEKLKVKDHKERKQAFKKKHKDGVPGNQRWATVPLYLGSEVEVEISKKKEN